MGLEYICPVCKQFNPSRKSKQDIIQQQKQEQQQREKVVVEEEEEEPQEEGNSGLTEEEINKLKEESIKDKSTIGSRVRQRHKTTVSDDDDN